MHKKVRKHTKKKSSSSSRNESMRLNKYIAHSGLCSRRKADEYIAEGSITVNGKVVQEMGYKVNSGDKVVFEGKVLKPERKTYVLLNKPKNYITTTQDERGRNKVTDLIKKATNERMYPVGRLDRNTTGLLVLTNDGDLAQKLMHPSFMVEKVYKVTLDKKLTAKHFEQIQNGLELEDGLAKIDAIEYVDETREVLGLEIHIGKNRIVRRIFESLGYQVRQLDRVLYAGLTKKNLPRGKWRYLTQKEVSKLKSIKT